MRIRDLAYETGSALDANRGRSLLTILGIVIGIGAVIAMTAMIGGVKESMVSGLGLTQARLVYINVYTGREITLDDVSALSERMDYYDYITASKWASGDAKSETKTFNASVQGVLPSYFKVMGMNVSQGELLTTSDESSSAMKVVLDQASVKELYGKPDEQVVGKTIDLGGATYTVIGVTQSEESLMSSGGTIYMPFSTCATRLAGSWTVDSMYGLAKEDADMETVADDTRQELIEYFNVSEADADDVYITTMQSIIDELNTTMQSFQVLMTSVASISLLVGGIGIMNMMLTNVTERIREIGLRKALGARASDITKQFLLESVCLCLVGGIFGIVLGYFGSFLITGLASDVFMGDGTQITPSIELSSVLIATAICVGIGILFGYYPARRAAKLDPVESLHYQ